MKLGLSSEGVTARYGYEKGFEMVKKSGFDTIDINVNKYWKNEDSVFYKSEDEMLTHFADVKKICDNLELEIFQTHGLLTSCVSDEKLSEHIKWGAELMLKATSLLGARYCVFHNVKLREWEDISTSDERMLLENKKFFQDFLTPLCKQYNVFFSLETHGKSTLKEGPVLDFVGDARNLKKSFDSIESDYKSFCLDTGHSNEAHFYGACNVVEAIKIFGKDIKTLHLHDNQGFYDSHLMPLVGAKGAIEWDKVFDTLEEVGYKGSYNWEISLSCFGNYLDKALPFIAGYLRNFTENKGRM